MTEITESNVVPFGRKNTGFPPAGTVMSEKTVEVVPVDAGAELGEGYTLAYSEDEHLYYLINDATNATVTFTRGQLRGVSQMLAVASMSIFLSESSDGQF